MHGCAAGRTVPRAGAPHQTLNTASPTTAGSPAGRAGHPLTPDAHRQRSQAWGPTTASIDVTADLASHSPYSVTVLGSGHPETVVDGFGGRPNNHFLERAVDVWAPHGVPVVRELFDNAVTTTTFTSTSADRPADAGRAGQAEVATTTSAASTRAVSAIMTVRPWVVSRGTVRSGNST